ncbi:MAG: HEAT repeat domain-containing protein [Armatimonadota bacterium]
MNRSLFFWCLAALLLSPLLQTFASAFPVFDDVPTLVAQLNDENPVKRARVVELLGETQEPAAVEPLLQALHDKSVMVRSNAALALGKTRDLRALDPLMQHAKDPASDIRLRAIEGLGYLNDIRALETIEAILSDKSDDIREVVVKALAIRKDPRAIGALTRALKDPSIRIRRTVVEGLVQYKTQAALDALLLALKDDSAEVCISTMGLMTWAPILSVRNIEWKSFNDQLLTLLIDKNVSLRSSAINLLGKLKDPRALDGIIANLKNENAFVCQCAVTALGEIGGVKAADALLPLVKTVIPEERSVLISALAECKDPRVIDSLISMLNGPNGEIDGQVVQALGQFGKLGVDALLIQLQKSTDTGKRKAIIEAFQYYSDERVIDPLITILQQEKDAALRTAAARVLFRYRIPRIVPLLLTALTDEDLPLCRVAANSLSSLSYVLPIPVDPLVTALQYQDAQVRLACANALNTLGDKRGAKALEILLHDTDEMVRFQALLYYSQQITEPAQFDSVLMALEDPSPHVRSRACEILLSRYQFTSEKMRMRFQVALIGMLKDPDSALRQSLVSQLGQTDAWAVDPLITVLKEDVKPEVREYAARSLGRLGDDRALAPLMLAIKDPVEWARSAAKDELGELGDTRAIPALMAIRDNGDEQDRFRTARALRLLRAKGLPDYPPTVQGVRSLLNATMHGGQSTESAMTKLRELPYVTTMLSMVESWEGNEQEEDILRQLISVLSQSGEPRTLEPILIVLHRQSEQEWNGTCLLAVQELRRFHDPRVIPFFIEAIQLAHNEYEKIAPAQALGEYADQRAQSALHDIFEGATTDDLRFTAAAGLARHGDIPALELLLTAVKSSENQLKYRALSALSRTGSPRVMALLLEMLAEKRDPGRGYVMEALRVLIQVNPELFPLAAGPLEAALQQQKDTSTRFNTIRLFLEKHDPRAVDWLITLFANNNNITINPDAVKTLCSINDPRVVKTCLTLLKDGDLNTREYVAEKLGDFGDLRATEPLIAALREDTTRVRLKAVESLAKLKDQRTIEPLLKVLTEKGTRVRSVAAFALKMITGQDFGEDHTRWQAWWKEQKTNTRR